MVIAIDPAEEFEYVLVRDRASPPEEQTVFVLRHLSYDARTAIANMSSHVDPTTNLTRGAMGSVMHETLRAGLKGWRNLRDRKGAQVQFVTEGREIRVLSMSVDPPKKETLARLHPVDAAELANEITEIARVSLDEGKG